MEYSAPLMRKNYWDIDCDDDGDDEDEDDSDDDYSVSNGNGNVVGDEKSWVAMTMMMAVLMKMMITMSAEMILIDR